MYIAGHVKDGLRALGQEWGLVAAQKELCKMFAAMSKPWDFLWTFLVFSPIQLECLLSWEWVYNFYWIWARYFLVSSGLILAEDMVGSH